MADVERNERSFANLLNLLRRNSIRKADIDLGAFRHGVFFVKVPPENPTVVGRRDLLRVRTDGSPVANTIAFFSHAEVALRYANEQDDATVHRLSFGSMLHLVARKQDRSSITMPGYNPEIFIGADGVEILLDKYYMKVAEKFFNDGVIVEDARDDSDVSQYDFHNAIKADPRIAKLERVVTPDHHLVSLGLYVDDYTTARDFKNLGRLLVEIGAAYGRCEVRFQGFMVRPEPVIAPTPVPSNVMPVHNTMETERLAIAAGNATLEDMTKFFSRVFAVNVTVDERGKTHLKKDAAFTTNDEAVVAIFIAETPEALEGPMPCPTQGFYTLESIIWEANNEWIYVIAGNGVMPLHDIQELYQAYATLDFEKSLVQPAANGMGIAMKLDHETWKRLFRQAVALPGFQDIDFPFDQDHQPVLNVIADKNAPEFESRWRELTAATMNCGLVSFTPTRVESFQSTGHEGGRGIS